MCFRSFVLSHAPKRIVKTKIQIYAELAIDYALCWQPFILHIFFFRFSHSGSGIIDFLNGSKSKEFFHKFTIIDPKNYCCKRSNKQNTNQHDYPVIYPQVITIDNPTSIEAEDL